MRSEITRIMVEVAVAQGLRDLRSQSHRRALRNLVEYGSRYARGPFQRSLFGTVREMLQSSSHPYYALGFAAAQSIADSYIMNFAINMGFESWTRGARIIRKTEAAIGCNIPWTVVVHLSDDQGQRLPLAQVQKLMDEGQTMGVMCYVLDDPALCTDDLCTLCERNPRCALIAFLPDEKLTSEVLDALEGTDNLMLVATRDSGDFVSAQELQRRKRIFGLCLCYGEAEALHLMETRDLRCPGAPDCLMPFFMPRKDCPPEAAHKLNDMLTELKAHPVQPLFPVDMSGDLQQIDRVISTDDCVLSVSVSGEYQAGHPARPTGMTVGKDTFDAVVRSCLKKG